MSLHVTRVFPGSTYTDEAGICFQPNHVITLPSHKAFQVVVFLVMTYL